MNLKSLRNSDKLALALTGSALHGDARSIALLLQLSRLPLKRRRTRLQLPSSRICIQKKRLEHLISAKQYFQFFLLLCVAFHNALHVRLDIDLQLLLERFNSFLEEQV